MGDDPLKLTMANQQFGLITVFGPEEQDDSKAFTFYNDPLPTNITQQEKDMHQFLDSVGLQRVCFETYQQDRKMKIFNSPARIKNELEAETKAQNASA